MKAVPSKMRKKIENSKDCPIYPNASRQTTWEFETTIS